MTFDHKETRVDRYTVSRNASGLGFSDGLVSDPEGGFVSYSDYTAALDEIARLREALELIATYTAGSVDAGMSPWTAAAALKGDDQ